MASFVYQHFHNLTTARNFIKKRYMKATKTYIKTAKDLKKTIVGCFENVKIGDPNKEQKHVYETDKIQLIHALQKCYLLVPIFVLMEKFGLKDKEAIGNAARYFGADKLKGLNDAKFWDNFEDMTVIRDYIREDNGQIGSESAFDVIMNVKDCKDEIYVNLFKAMTPLLRLRFGVSQLVTEPIMDIDFDTNFFIKELRNIRVRTDPTRRLRRTDSAMEYDYGDQTAKWMEGVDRLVRFQHDPTLVEEYEQYYRELCDTLYFNFQAIEHLTSVLETRPVKDYDSCLFMTRVVGEWLSRNQRRATTQQSIKPAKTNAKLNSNRSRRNMNPDAFLKSHYHIVDLVQEAVSNEHPDTQLWILKAALGEMIKRQMARSKEPQCEGCSYLSHPKGMKKVMHEVCPSAKYLGIGKLGADMRRGNLMGNIIRVIKAAKKNHNFSTQKSNNKS